VTSGASAELALGACARCFALPDDGFRISGETLRGRSGRLPPGSRASGSSGLDRPFRRADSLPVGQPTGHHCRRGNRGQVLVENLKRVGRPARGSLLGRSAMPWSAARPVSPRAGVGSAGGKGAGSRPHGGRGMLWRGQEAQESIGLPLLRLGWVRIRAESNALELRGTVTSWSSEQENALPETARG
jgi:hypothetical protein